MTIYGNSFLLSEVIAVSEVKEDSGGSVLSKICHFNIYLKGGGLMPISKHFRNDNTQAIDEFYGYQQDLVLKIQRQEEAFKDLAETIEKMAEMCRNENPAQSLIREILKRSGHL